MGPGEARGAAAEDAGGGPGGVCRGWVDGLGMGTQRWEFHLVGKLAGQKHFLFSH